MVEHTGSHTPLPWTIDEKEPGEIWISDALRTYPVCMVTASGSVTERDKADAALIVRAVNTSPAVAVLVKALENLIADIEDYERVNNLAPSPGKNDCWQSVTIAKESLSRFRELEKGSAT